MIETHSAVTRDGVIGHDGSEIVTIDQATGAELAQYPVAGPDEAAAAVAASRSVHGSWWNLGFEGRAQRLRAWQREIARSGEEAAALIHAENGKPTDDARSEVLATLQHLQFAIGNAERVLGRRDLPAGPITGNQRAWVEHQPYGVVGVIGPWNFPLMTPGAIVINALAAGNTVILKPSHVTPGVGEWLVQTWQRSVSDFPAVLQHLNGYGATGQALITAGLDKLAFTGSVATGKTVAAQCAQTLTPMLLELGGNDGAIVAADADLDEAAAHIVWGALQNTGHGCISLEVAYVVEAVYDTFVEKISDLARGVRVGSDENAQIGPVPLPTQIGIIRDHIQDALANGATAVVGGLETVAGGRYVAPTILVDVPAGALAAIEETFGPTLAVVKVADTEQAVTQVNDGPYGLGSAVFSRQHGEAIARRLRVGMTSINDALVFSMNPALPFGGRGDSGYGRKHGDEGLREFAYPHSFSTKTGPARLSSSTFDRPAGAMKAALAAARDRILAADDTRTN
ncbi:aldehyde dehydrogenase family protein [Actinoplanes derwentensis]|uniref:Acyl-CoA reductase n=1 Tax=Actinoplanes derwentensis TaxID=113562 RepID=A0A1H2B6J3_9ACTN|nr:aldehyde dehydrogenase family protein [Actinoplanes derwentensis]GID87674.1 aldehyde dehydrogenase [Actinoplanes derwentensis]SDT53406.1 Acyl-CoA reductase [Actinoplanes derwentensis]